ncbi:MAG: hypothetical protein JO011_17710 [Ktedonobacteraceae bacterium]|nr:hypothetical protein [Ktedonobacteraceae bacterium]
MTSTMAARIARANRIRQTYTLLGLGVVFILAALLLRLNPYGYPVGVLLLGIGLLIGAFLYPPRLMIAGWLVTPLGIAVFLTFKHLIPGNQILAFYILAIGVGMLAIALAARRGYVGKGAVSTGLIVLAVGIVELLLALGLTPPGFIPFMLSLWLPGIGLIVVGLLYLLTNGRGGHAF